MTFVFVVFVTVAVKVFVPPLASTLAVVGAIEMATGTTTAAHPAMPFAVAGAAVVADVDATTTSAVSCRPTSSTTVKRTVNEPDAGATTVAVDVLAP